MPLLIALLLALQTIGTGPTPPRGYTDIQRHKDKSPLTRDEVCSIPWGHPPAPYKRHVPDDMKKTVLLAAGLRWEDRAHYEIDHIIPRELGGADVVENLQAQCCIDKGRISGPAHEKDVSENRLHRLLCAEHVSLKEAQDIFRFDPTGKAAADLYSKRVP